MLIVSTLVIPHLNWVTALPLTLTGDKNLTLRVGTLALQLGTAVAPVLTADVLAAALIDERRTNSQMPLPVVVQKVSSSQPLDPAASQLQVPGKDGDYFAAAQNILSVNTWGREPEILWVRARRNGKLQFTGEAGVWPRVVNSQAELDHATARKVKEAVACSTRS
ncbi:hypothetical protein GCM10008955_38430 [Deinococcus malanensis]|uniref:Uncharacterized protein n=1 Tax=Deinococcus malanensis TaxID=1706855 RepID=A0ABQ2F4U0_9DEIO|nr:hypothetical protein [Deinococcus malanensis]GGK40956.1 hypothetical protein GCM10008955_38430 [Deinococcus malanensis]